MVRKQVYIEARQEAMLKRRAADLEVTEAELIRAGIDRVMEAAPSPWRGSHDTRAWEEALEFMRARLAEGPVEGGRTWKREDLHERG